MKTIRLITLCGVVALGFAITLFSQLTDVSQAQRRRVDISIGTPSVWTLAQAHYLLAQMQKNNRGWKLVDLDDLDPNAINRQRIEVLQTLIGITGEFDAGANFKNRILQDRYEANFSRQQTVKSELDRRNNDLIQANRDLYFIGLDLNKLQSANPKDEDAIKLKTSEQQAKTLERDSISNRITALNSELTTLVTENISNNLPSLATPFGSNAQASPSPLAPKLSQLIDKQFLDKLFSDTAKSSSKLQASIQLDNYIQMQYEVISKQLTLLRDEVGTDKRVIFLELPTSIYSVPKTSENFIAQVRWQVTGYCPEVESYEQTELSNVPGEDDEATQTLASQLDIRTQAAPVPEQPLDDTCFRNLGDRQAYTVDIIPRQSALNVNEVHNTSSGFAVAARFMTMFGLGGKVDYQRQREVYDQFVYQDVFASGFGKGSDRFGWTFGPLPGTKTIAPGVRTTFAVLVVPADAQRIRIAARAYAFRRTEDQPAPGDNLTTCTASESCRTFLLDIPSDSTNGFFINRADYAPVQSGKRVTLVLGGPYFSPQVGVLVNGVPLARTVAISPIDAATPSPSPSPGTPAGLAGEYEYVNSRRLIASFSMGSDYEGTPVIALISPQKTSTINRYRLRVNGIGNTSLERQGLLNPMFFSPLAITRVQVSRPPSIAPYVRAMISGRGFRRNALITVNGARVNSTVQRSTHQYDIEFYDPGVPSWDITIKQSTAQGQEEVSTTLTRPFSPRVTYDILRLIPGQRRQPARMDLKISGPDLMRITDISVLNNGNFSASASCYAASLGAPPPRGRRPPVSCTSIASGEVIVTVNVPTRRGHSLLLLVTADSGESAMLNILPPMPPTITSIVNEANNKPEGAIEGGYPVVIRGRFLEQVERVFFGNKMAQIQQASPGVITVTVPAGEEGRVRVVLETNTPYQNKFLSNSEDFADPKSTKAMFTYVKPKR